VALFGSAVRYIYQCNSGRSSARNRGIDLATGQFIAFLDSDDVFVPTKLERQLREMERHPDVALAHTSYARMDETGRVTEIVRSGRFTGNVFPEILTGCPIATPTVLVRTIALGRDLRFDESVEVGEDIILWSRLAARGPVLGIDKCLSHATYTASSSAACASVQAQAFRNMIGQVVHGTFPLGGHAKQRVLSDLVSAAVGATLEAGSGISLNETIEDVMAPLTAESLPHMASLRRRILVDFHFAAALRNLKARELTPASRDLAMCLCVAPLSTRPYFLIARTGAYFMRSRTCRTWRAIRGQRRSP
jgi:hypothetical protein